MSAGWTCRFWTVLALLGALNPQPALAELRGHGGPIRAIAVTVSGDRSITASFDQRALIWSLGDQRALAVLRFHQAAVNAVAALPGERWASAGEDGRIAVWILGQSTPLQVLTGHTGPIAALAVSPDGSQLASAAWDRTVRLWPLDGGPGRLLGRHDDNVNGVGFLPDGLALVSAGYDAALRWWPLTETASARTLRTEAPLNALAIAPDGEIVAASGDGRLRFFAADGTPQGTIAIGATPLTTVAVAPDGRLVAAAGIRGAVIVLDRATRRKVATLVGPGLPVWSAAFLPSGEELLTGGSDGVVRRWHARTGVPRDSIVAADPTAVPAADAEGARVFRACAACHSLRPDDRSRAGPTLHGLFGRRIGTVPGYDYSPALTSRSIVWTPATVAELFRTGPGRYTPGTRMPEQSIRNEAELAALIRFLERATAAD